jgi:hypothetical protein
MRVKNRNDKGGVYKEVVGIQSDIFGASHYVVVSKGGRKQSMIPMKQAKVKKEAKKTS